jgi:hypothetical protein
VFTSGIYIPHRPSYEVKSNTVLDGYGFRKLLALQ